MECPNCKSNRSIKNGLTYYGKQRFKCKICGRQFIEGSQYQHISQETKNLIDLLLLEKIPLAVIARSTGVSLRWLHNYLSS